MRESLASPHASCRGAARRTNLLSAASQENPRSTPRPLSSKREAAELHWWSRYLARAVETPAAWFQSSISSFEAHHIQDDAAGHSNLIEKSNCPTAESARAERTNDARTSALVVHRPHPMCAHHLRARTQATKTPPLEQTFSQRRARKTPIPRRDPCHLSVKQPNSTNKIGT